MVQDPSSGFAGDEHAGAGVPGLVTKLDAGVEPAFGGPGKVDRSDGLILQLGGHADRPWLSLDDRCDPMLRAQWGHGRQDDIARSLEAMVASWAGGVRPVQDDRMPRWLASGGGRIAVAGDAIATGPRSPQRVRRSGKWRDNRIDPCVWSA